VVGVTCTFGFDSQQVHKIPNSYITTDMSKTISVVCAGCNITFEKKKGEVARALKCNFKNHYCSNKCQATFANNGKGNVLNLRQGSLRDEFSAFRYYISKAKSRHKMYRFDNTDLTLEFLKELWEKQKGICPLTGWDLELPPTIGKWSKTKVSINTASLDRIEPKKPYTRDNVRFVAHIANMAKFTYSDEEVIKFCLSVVKHRT
jgi:hypothetical protein